MRSRTKRGCLAALALALSAPAVVGADIWDFSPQFPLPAITDAPNETYLIGDALYWSGGAADFNYAEVGNIVVTNPPGIGGGNYQSNALIERLFSQTVDSEWAWGFRVGVGRQWDNYFIDSRFTFWEGESVDTTERGSNNTLSLPGLVFDGANVTGFQRIEANVLQRILMSETRFGVIGNNTCRGRWEFFGLFNAHCLKLRLRSKGTGNMTLQNQQPVDVPIFGAATVDLDQLGVGAGGGFEGTAYLPCHFQFTGGLQSAGTFSRVAGRFTTDQITPQRDFANNDEFYQYVSSPFVGGSQTCLYLNFQGNIDLRYVREICGCKLDVGLGYEVHTFKFVFFSGPTLSLIVRW